ncbi:hypothetical protein QCA50_006762 [Cerrena zonata]|uniref:Secreted protein n=1 Tax=Cerrena zonata TaxID=2478898 RepID=A0AAW0GKE5_9APHY
MSFSSVPIVQFFFYLPVVLVVVQIVFFLSSCTSPCGLFYNTWQFVSNLVSISRKRAPPFLFNPSCLVAHSTPTIRGLFGIIFPSQLSHAQLPPVHFFPAIC